MDATATTLPSANPDVIVVRKGVPLPSLSRGAGAKGTSKYPFAKMQVGDCFFMPAAERSRLSTACRAAGKRMGAKFALRGIPDGTVGVWRVS